MMPTRTRGFMARKRSASNKVPNQGGLAFGRNLMVLGGLIFAPEAYGTVEGALTLRWPRAEATITTADLVRQMSTARGIDGRSFEEGWNSFHVLYHYNVAGPRVRGGRRRPARPRCASDIRPARRR